jgi:hypothetical protein
MRTRVLLTLGLLVAVACTDDVLLRTAPIPVDQLFERYASVGNSITAGFQSGGINEVTQAESYAVLLAEQMNTEFFVPWMNNPGCPPLFANVFTQTSTAPGVDCALRRRDSLPPPYLNNVAVPGAEVIDAVANLDPESNANELTAFFLGGLTQMEMLQRTDPTFVTVWIGNNDVLGAATNSTDAGNPALVTPPVTFASRYGQMLNVIDATGPEGGVLIGVADVTTIPFFSTGSTYYGLFLQGAFAPAPFTVTANCAPPRGDSVYVPFPFGGALLQTAFGGTPTTLDCSEPQTIQPAEFVNLINTVAEYNDSIADAAAARGWVYFDPNPALVALRADPTQVAPFPNFGTPPNFTPCSASPFGLAFSCDAVHPSASTHQLIANAIIQAINAAYGAGLEEIP